MMGIDPRAARATWTVILIGLLCLVIYSIRNTVFVFIVSLLFAYFAAAAGGFHRPFSSHATVAYTGAGHRLPRAGDGYSSCRHQCRNSSRYQANNLAQRITDFLKPSRRKTLPLPEPVKPIGDQVLSMLRSTIKEHYQEILQTLPQAVLRGVSAVANLVFIVIVPILSFFFLKDGRMMQRYLVSQVEDDVNRGVLKEIATDLNVLLAQYNARPGSPRPRRIDHIRYLFLHHGRPLRHPTRGAGLPSGIHPMLGPLTASIIILLVAGFSGYHHLVVIAGFLGAYRISRITSCRRTC